MNRMTAMLALVCFLCGCSSKNRDLEKAMAMRQKVLGASECCFDAEITADYGDKQYRFSMQCSADQQGNLVFSVAAPETLSGISGSIDEKGGKLTFDDTALNFPLMADDQLSPVCAPWIFFRTLRSGYLTAAGMEEELLRLTIHDSYQEDALQLDIWINGEEQPVQADILHNGVRILSVGIKNFQIL